jgi:hypothetical protein
LRTIGGRGSVSTTWSSQWRVYSEQPVPVSVHTEPHSMGLSMVPVAKVKSVKSPVNVESF